MVNSKKVSKGVPPKREPKIEKMDGLEKNLGKAKVRLG